MSSFQHEHIEKMATDLGLSTMCQLTGPLAEEASTHDWTYLDYLERLLDEETSAKFSRRVRVKSQMANFPFRKTLAQFDFSFQPSVDKRKLNELASLKFIEEKENILFLGPPGVGKTHLAVSLGMVAIEAGMSVYFTRVHDMIHTLLKARQTGTMTRKMATYIRFPLLIVDEIGYLPLNQEEAALFFELVSGRYEKGSLILTSNRSYGSWGDMFPDTIITAATLDRLLHHSTTINIKGNSYRLKEKAKAGLVSQSSLMKAHGTEKEG